MPPPPLPEMVRKADKVGAVASAWVIDAKDHPTTVASWLINHPSAHPLWNQWTVGLLTLRSVEGVPPAKLDYPEAEFELLVIAQNPDYPISNPTAGEFQLAPLHPIDVDKQFHGVNDEVAAHIVELLVDAVVEGSISPDQDHRRIWEQSIDQMVEHFTIGHTPPDQMN
jgi:hypothetical protein